MLKWLGRMPLTWRLPLAAAAMIFVAAIGTTQLAMRAFATHAERQIDRIGHVYLDGLTAAVLPLAREQDAAGLSNALRRALDVHVGIKDRRLAVLDANRRVMASAERSGPPFEVAALPAIHERAEGIQFDESDRSFWVWRPIDVGPGGQAGIVLANLDAEDFVQERDALYRWLFGVDIAISAACALVGLVVARRIQRPITTLTRHLQLRAGQPAAPVDPDAIPEHDVEIAALIEAYNEMAAGARERETLLDRMVEQERDAALGRMAAVLAHEVRNPLGGIETAIRTLRRYGDQPDARSEALDFVERGVVALREVADATLQTHRPGSARRHLSRQDILDVQRLVEAEASARDVTVDVDVDMPSEVAVASTEVRQLLLNLLLNAVHATSPHGCVKLTARYRDDGLTLEVGDQGPGPTLALTSALTTMQEPASHGGLGVPVIVRLVERLSGSVSVEAPAGGGTRITLRLPVREATRST
jgi:signal transduction histidine kinase